MIARSHVSFPEPDPSAPHPSAPRPTAPSPSAPQPAPSAPNQPDSDDDWEELIDMG